MVCTWTFVNTIVHIISSMLIERLSLGLRKQCCLFILVNSVTQLTMTIDYLNWFCIGRMSEYCACCSLLCVPFIVRFSSWSNFGLCFSLATTGVCAVNRVWCFLSWCFFFLQVCNVWLLFLVLLVVQAALPQVWWWRWVRALPVCHRSPATKG